MKTVIENVIFWILFCFFFSVFTDMQTFAQAIPSYDPARAALVERYADAMGYCGEPPIGKKGDVVVYWTRDATGACTVQNFKTIK